MSTGPNTSNLVDIDKEKALFFMRRLNRYIGKANEEINKDPWKLITRLQNQNYEYNLLLAEINLITKPIKVDMSLDEPIQFIGTKHDAEERLKLIREVLESWQML